MKLEFPYFPNNGGTDEQTQGESRKKYNQGDDIPLDRTQTLTQ